MSLLCGHMTTQEYNLKAEYMPSMPCHASQASQCRTWHRRVEVVRAIDRGRDDDCGLIIEQIVNLHCVKSRQSVDVTSCTIEQLTGHAERVQVLMVQHDAFKKARADL